jgi:hypothetical protein
VSQLKQYPALPCFSVSQVLIRHAVRVFGLLLSSHRQPWHGFLSPVYAIQRLQFIPQGATSVVCMTFVFGGLVDGMFASSRPDLLREHGFTCR